jgi:hypothetical protein
MAEVYAKDRTKHRRYRPVSQLSDDAAQPPAARRTMP